MKLFITEFAESKKEIERELTYATTPIIRHLFKLYCMPNSSSRNHWMTEIANFLSSVKRLSGKNKFPSKYQILDWTYYKWEDLLTDIEFMKREIDTIEFDYNITVDKTIEDICSTFYTLCYDYFTWLANELSSYGNVSHREIHNKLNEMF